MNYIVLDLEWNQPISRHTQAFKKMGATLSCELIQIGAVKLDENKKMLGSFNSYIAPSFYKKINPRIQRITGISQDDADSSKPFPEVFQNFIAWCGDNAVFVTWGQDDMSVFARNISAFPLERTLAPSYDAQQLFGHMIQSGKNRPSLRKAMLHYCIPSNAEHPFHSAVDDAYYTALVMQRFENLEDILNYQTKIKWPSEDEASLRAEHATEQKVRSISSALESAFAQNPLCPICKKETSISEGYIPTIERYHFMGLSDCKTHGLIKTKLCFVKANKSGFLASISSELSEEQHPAYVKTKHYQWAKKVSQLKEKEKKHAGKNKRKTK